MNTSCKSENWDVGVIAFVKHFCTNSQKLKSFLDKGADKCNKNATFVAEVLYYTQNIGLTDKGHEATVNSMNL